MPRPKMLLILVLINLALLLSASSYAQGFKIQSLGIRGGINLKNVAIPPVEKENFYQTDVFMTLSTPWRGQMPSDWDVNWRVNGAVGILRGGGDTGFVSELGPGIAFYRPNWGMTFDFGTGLSVLSRQHYGEQNMGGPVQIVAHGGVGFDLGSGFVAGWRFHHISDATIYGTHSKGVDINFLELRHNF